MTRQPTKNPFKVKPRFFGESARLKTWEGGFHTAVDVDFAAVYAQQKWMSSPFVGEKHHSAFANGDVPVILTLDMAGIPRVADIDSRRACIEVMQYEHIEALDIRSVEDFIETISNRDREYPDVGDDVMSAMFSLASSSSVEVAFQLVSNYFEGLEYASKAQNERDQSETYGRLRSIAAKLRKKDSARLSREDDEFLVDVFGQAVYWEDISDARLIEVRYMAPYLPSVVAEDVDDDEEDSHAIDQAIEAGFHPLTDTDTSLNPQFKTAWTRSKSTTPLFQWGFAKQEMPSAGWLGEHQPQRLEFHGTSLSNLLRACPWLVDDALKKPPKPYAGTVAALARRVADEPDVVATEDDDTLPLTLDGV